TKRCVRRRRLSPEAASASSLLPGRRLREHWRDSCRKTRSRRAATPRPAGRTRGASRLAGRSAAPHVRLPAPRPPPTRARAVPAAGRFSCTSAGRDARREFSLLFRWLFLVGERWFADDRGAYIFSSFLALPLRIFALSSALIWMRSIQ